MVAGVSIGTRRLSNTPVWPLVDKFCRETGNRGEFPPPFGAVRLLLEEQDVGGQFRSVDPPLELAYTRAPSGVFVLSMTTVPGRADEPRRIVPAGRYRVRVASEFYQEVVAVADFTGIPRLPQLDLLPGATYPFSQASRGQGISAVTLLRGSIRERSGEPVRDAIVSVIAPVNNTWKFRECRTDNTGQWVVVIPDAALPPDPQDHLDVTVRVALPNAPPPIDLAHVGVSRGGSNSLKQTAFSGLVQDARGRPISGATVAIQGEAATVKTGGAGQWVFYFALNKGAAPTAVTATLPDGRSQTQVQPIVTRATTIVPTFRFP